MALHKLPWRKKFYSIFFKKSRVQGRALGRPPQRAKFPPRSVSDAHSLPLQKGTADKSKPLCARRKLKNKKSAAPQGRKTS